MKFRFLFLGLVCIIHSLSSQESILNQQGNYLTFGIGIPLHTVRDQAHSVLAYRGSGLRFSTTYERFLDDAVFRVALSFDNASLKAYVKPQQDIKRKAKLADVHLNVGFYKEVASSIDSKQYVGMYYATYINARQYPLPTNNTAGLLMHSSIGIGAIDRHDLNKSTHSVFGYINTPILSAVFRPTYIGIPNVLHIQKVKFKHVLQNMSVVTINKLFSLSAGLSLYDQVRPWRSNSYNYDWRLVYSKLPSFKPYLGTVGSLSYGYRVQQ